jgi:DNA-binding GntR family transcriptional regulator
MSITMRSPDFSSLSAITGDSMANKHLEKSIRQDIYEKIRDDITFGYLAPGERLTEKKLSDLYKVSRSPIREALRQLESEGLISFERNKGIEVAKLTIRQVYEIFNIRGLLEGYAAQIAIARITEQDINYLEDLHKKMIKAVKTMDRDGWRNNNSLFHSFFRDKADSESLRHLILMLRRRTYPFQYMATNFPRYYEIYIGIHKTIIEACYKKDADLAKRTMEILLHKVRDVIIETMKKVDHGLLI